MRRASRVPGRPPACWMSPGAYGRNRPNQAVKQSIQWSSKADAWSYSVLNPARAQGGGLPYAGHTGRWVGYSSIGWPQDARGCAPSRVSARLLTLPQGICGVSDHRQPSGWPPDERFRRSTPRRIRRWPSHRDLVEFLARVFRAVKPDDCRHDHEKHRYQQKRSDEGAGGVA